MAIPFPFPGMKIKQVLFFIFFKLNDKIKGADFWKNNNGRHWATPKWEPMSNIHCKDYEEQDPIDCIRVITNAWFNIKRSSYDMTSCILLLYFRKKYRRGKMAAIKIQKMFRGINVLNLFICDSQY